MLQSHTLLYVLAGGDGAALKHVTKGMATVLLNETDSRVESLSLVVYISL